MGRYIRRRLLTAIPVFLGITLLVFGMLHLAAGSVLDLMGEGSGAPPPPPAGRGGGGFSRAWKPSSCAGVGREPMSSR